MVEQVRRLRKGKASGEDGIENEAWRYMANDVGEVLWKLLKKVWERGGMLKEWNKGVINPIYKKGEKSDVKNYRGVTLLSRTYKIYASILNRRLEKELEGKLHEGQFGFRKGRGTMDAVYVLNYIVNREIAKKKGRLFAFFVDLKAAFDKVDRDKLDQELTRLKIRTQLRERIMEIYKETRNIVKIGNRRSKEFWTKNGVRQGCPLCPTLFNVYTTNLEEAMKKGQAGRMVVGREKFWTIMYTDDIVLLAEDEGEMKEMMKRFKRYLEKKRLLLSAEKSKMMYLTRDADGQEKENGGGERKL